MFSFKKLPLILTAAVAAFTLPPSTHARETQTVDDGIGSPDYIIGGKVLPEGKRPYLASLGRKELHECGASLIHPNVVLTAADCVTNENNGNFSPLDWIDFKRYDLTSGLGGVDRRNLSRTEGKGPNYVQRHPEYVNIDQGNDFATICLEQPVEDITPVKLNSDRKIPVDGSTLEAFGWGRTQTTPNPIVIPNLPQTADLTYLTNKEVQKPPYKDVVGDVTATEMFTIDPKQSNCQGDRGGPLIVNGGRKGEDVQVGVMSFFTSNSCLEKDSPNGYARVSARYDWIQGQIKRCVAQISEAPTGNPTLVPTEEDSTKKPTKRPTNKPTKRPTKRPTNKPTRRPDSYFPTYFPTLNPTFIPTTYFPTFVPTTASTFCEFLDEEDDFDILLNLLHSTGLCDTLAGNAVTLFAPVDEAFKALPAEVLECLGNKKNTDALEDLLSYHVINDKISTAKIRRGLDVFDAVSFETLLGESNGPDSDGTRTLLDFTSPDTSSIGQIIFINEDTKIIEPFDESVFGNGILHTIDKVLVPEDTDFDKVCNGSKSAKKSSSKAGKRDIMSPTTPGAMPSPPPPSSKSAKSRGAKLGGMNIEENPLPSRGGGRISRNSREEEDDITHLNEEEDEITHLNEEEGLSMLF